MEGIVDLIVRNGMAVVIIAYFLFKDYKFNESFLKVLSEVKEVLVELRTYHAKESSGHDDNVRK